MLWTFPPTSPQICSRQQTVNMLQRVWERKTERGHHLWIRSIQPCLCLSPAETRPGLEFHLGLARWNSNLSHHWLWFPLEAHDWFLSATPPYFIIAKVKMDNGELISVCSWTMLHCGNLAPLYWRGQLLKSSTAPVAAHNYDPVLSLPCANNEYMATQTQEGIVNLHSITAAAESGAPLA